MKKLIYTTSFIIVSNILFAQSNITIKEGPALKENPRGYICGQDDKSIFMASGEYVVDVYKYDKQTLAQNFEANFDIREKKDYYAYSRTKFGVSEGGLVVLFDLYNTADKKRTLYAKTVSKTGVVEQGRKELQSVDEGRNFSAFSFCFTKNSSKFIVCTHNNEAKTITVTIYNTKTLTSESSREISKIYKENNISITPIDILPNGDLKLAAEYQKDDRGHNLDLLLKNGEKKFSELMPEPDFDENKYIYSKEKITTSDNKSIYGGMYIEKVEKYDKKHPPELKTGTFLAIADNNNKIISESYNLLEKDVYDKLSYKIKDDNGKNKTPGEKSVACERVVEMNGNYYVICPHSYTFTITQGNATKRIDCQREIIVSKYNAQGKFEWMRIIPKFDRDAGSHDFMKKDGKLYFFYLENEKDKDMDLIKYNPDDISETRLSNGNFTCTTIDEQGTMKKQILPYPKDKGNTYKPQHWDFFLTGDNDLLIEYIDKGGRLAVITLK